jgi:Flp pilus assembly protein TadD
MKRRTHMQFLKYLLIITLTIYPFISTRAESSMTKEEARKYREEGYKMQMGGNVEGARQMYEKAAAMDPRYAEVNNDLGVVYEGLGQADRAISMYKKALEIDQNYLPAYANLGFIYEKTGDTGNAAFYWKKRYDLGQEGEYWREVSRQHLLKLGAYPEIANANLEEQARILSQKMTVAHEQARFKNLEEATLDYNLGCSFMTKGDYVAAIKEFEAARDLKPKDASLTMRIEEFHVKAEQALRRMQAKVNAEAALSDIQKEDYPAAGVKLQDSLNAVNGISKKADVQPDKSQK